MSGPMMTISVYKTGESSAALFILPRVGETYSGVNHILVTVNPFDSNDDIHSQLSDFHFERLHETLTRMQNVDITYAVTNRETGKTRRYTVTQ